MNEMNNPNSKFWKYRRSASLDEDPYRKPWERDYGRVVHSAAFRRLQAKTQILGVDEGDFHRTRLTHTLEVSQIGEAITKRLRRQLDKGSPEWRWLPPAKLMRTICLAHDLGHPPFGHGGEVALNRCMLANGGFEGNGQTLRIITKLDNSTENYGMDLTRRALLGTIKYPAPYNDVVNKSCYPGKQQDFSGDSVFVANDFKPPKCYLNEEQETVNWVTKGFDEKERSIFSKAHSRPLKDGKQRHKKTRHKSLDASIMDVADDIAYGVHDLEDGIALKLVDKRDFEDWFAECKRKDKLEPLLEDECLVPEFDSLANKLFSRDTHERKQTIGHIVGSFIAGVEIKEEPVLKHPLFRYRAELDFGKRNALDALTEIVANRIVKSPLVQQLEFKGQKIVTELFHAFHTDPNRLLEESARKRIDDGDQKQRVICDYIAGMTDDYAIRRYRQLFVPRAGSVFDRL